MRKEIMGVTFDDVTLEEAVAAGEALAAGPGFSYVVTPNPEIVAMARQTETYREILNGAGLVLPDGIGVVHAAKILGTPLKGRVPGIDFASALVERLARSGLRLFLLGAKPGVAEQAGENLKKRYPDLLLCGTHDGYFQTGRPGGGPDSGRPGGRGLCPPGAPKQERWMAQYGPETGAHLDGGAGRCAGCVCRPCETGAGNLAEAGAGVVLPPAPSAQPAGPDGQARPCFCWRPPGKGKAGKAMKRGRLIVIEGTDGSGKSTQFARLCRRAEHEGIAFQRLVFPQYQEESSALLRMYLNGEFGRKPGDVNAYAASSFYAVDRYASWKKVWQGYYEAGGLVLADRYTTSNAVHQSSKVPPEERPAFFQWLFDFEYGRLGLPEPDLVLYLDMPTERAVDMLRQRERDTHTQGHP